MRRGIDRIGRIGLGTYVRLSGSMSNRHAGQVVRWALENQGSRHDEWKTCEQGSVTTFGYGFSFGVSEAVDEDEDDVDVEAFGCPSGDGCSTCSLLSWDFSFSSCPKPPSPSSKDSQQIAQPGPASPSPFPPTLCKRFTKPTGTSSNPARSLFARSGSSGSSGKCTCIGPPTNMSKRPRPCI